jgi:hypothetical protein
MKTHIKIVKREDAVGLGANSTDDEIVLSVTDTWWAGAFDRAVQERKEKKTKVELCNYIRMHI